MTAFFGETRAFSQGAHLPAPLYVRVVVTYSPGMRVKVRLTAASLEGQLNPPAGLRLAHSGLRSLGMLIMGDPVVNSDDVSWYLSSTAIDEADALMDGSGGKVISDTIDTINGIGTLMLRRTPFSYERVFSYAAEGGMDGTRAIVSGGFLGIIPVDNLDAVSAQALVALAAKDYYVQRVLTLLAQAKPESIWFDWYRIWDIMRGYFPSKHHFKDWVSSLDSTYYEMYYDFEYSANDPDYGNNQRHALRKYKTPEDKNGRLAGHIAPGVAENFVKRVIVMWIEEEHGLVVKPQWL